VRVDWRARRRAGRLAARAAELALRVTRPRESRVVARRLGDIHFGIYTSQRYLEHHGPIADSNRLQGHALVVYPRPFDVVPEMAWILRRADPDPPIFRVPSIIGMQHALLSGAGIGVLPTFLADVEGLVELETESLPPPRGLWLAMHEDLRNAPHVRAVADHLIQLVGDAFG